MELLARRYLMSLRGGSVFIPLLVQMFGFDQ